MDRKTRRASAAWVAGLAALTASIPIEVGGETPHELTWSAVVKMIDALPGVAAGRHDLAAARAAVDAAGAVPNPGLEASLGYGAARDGSASRLEWGLSLSVPLGWLARRGARVAAAEASVEATGADVAARRRRLRLELRTLFWRLVYAQQRVATLSAIERQTAELARVVKRVDSGEARPVEATRVAVEVAQLAGELDQARLSLRARRRQLALVLDLPAGRSPVARADLAALPRPPSPGWAERVARRRHPAVRAARARVAAGQARLTAERRQRVPALALAAFTDHDRRAYGVGLSVDLPLWNWRSGSVARARSALSAQRQRAEARARQTAAAAVTAQAACEAGTRAARRYRERIVPAATSAASTIERTYRHGEARLLELIDARRTLLETQRRRLAALVRAQIACSRLRALVGTPEEVSR